MPGGQLSLFACICGVRSKHSRESPTEESQEPLGSKPQQRPVSSNIQAVLTDNANRCHRTDSDVQALFQLQRLLGGFWGAWLPRTHAVLSTIAVFLNATDVSFYGASGSGKAGIPSCFVLLAREPGDSSKIGRDGESAPIPGFEVWPASDRTRLDGQGRTDEYKMPAVANLQPSKREIYLRRMPSMLDQMLASQAPVIHTSGSSLPRNIDNRRAATRDEPTMLTFTKGDSGQDVISLVPLTVGDRIVGALWIVRCGSGTATDKSPNESSTPAAASLASDSAALSRGGGGGGGLAAAAVSCGLLRSPSVPPPSPRPPLLSSPEALQQLSIIASMCLLGSDMTFMTSLCDSLHQLSAANSMQQLVGTLCDALGAHMRERFLLEPRVFAALVPETASAVGLMFSRPPPVTPAVSRGATKVPRASGITAGTLGSGIGGMEAAYSDFSRREGLLRSQSPRGVVMGVKELNSLGARPTSDNVARCLPHSAGVAAAITAITGGGSMEGQVLNRMWRGGPMMQRVVALTQGDLALVDASLGAGTAANSVTSGSCVALRVKPFPLAQTLLRHVVRTFAAAAAAGTGALSSSDSASGGGSGSNDYFHSRACAVEVEDCALHVQDPKKPSRDILFLIANSGASQMLSALGAAGGPSIGTSASANGSFTSSRRVVSSMLLLVLPAGDGKARIGLYITFPQTLPLQLLRQARLNLMDILEVLAPLIARKLTTDLAVELETLATAAPGSYAVVEAPEMDDRTDAQGSVTPGNMDESNALRASETKILLQVDGDGEAAADRMVPLYSPLVQSFMYDSRGGGGGTGSSAMNGAAGGSALGATRSLKLVDTIASTHVGGDNTVGMTSLLSVRESALGVSNGPGCMTLGCEALTRSTVIHMEELDIVQSTMRAQMPLLVASMQNSIYNARVEAAVAAAAASMNRSVGSFAASNAAPFVTDQSDLAQLELHTQLGHGGCAVVFKGTMGTLDCAIKLMEMPDVDGVDAMGSSTTDPALKWVDTTGGDADGGGGVGGKESDKEAGEGGSLAARRALLRNAMELAAMTSISHPNIMQVYSTFSNVTLGRRVMTDGTDHFYLKTIDGSVSAHPDAAPICVAIVCEWCDKGCLGSALQKRTFPLPIPQPNSVKKLGSQNSGLGSSGGSKQAKLLDFKGILMTLLDVAMALRHLHSHNIIHRDVKPANVLLKGNVMDPRGFTAKLADFGFVTLLNEPGDDKSGGEPFAWVDETCGTVTHMPPESWQKPARLDSSCDVYSFGILMWEMTAGGTRPYPEVQPKNIARVVQRGMRPTFDESVPVQYRFLAQRCWTTEPMSRPRTSELVTTISQMLTRMGL